MKVLVFGGAGFVGLNIVEVLLTHGHRVTVFDRSGLPAAAQEVFARHADHLSVVQGDILDRTAVERVIAGGHDAIVLAAAITAGAERDAADPESILQVNLLAQTPILTAARRGGVKRVINLSSASAFGAAAFRHTQLDEEHPCDPVSLYAITKFASERVAARLAELWQFDIISVRLSGVFGRWERATGVRDTLSPQMQIMTALTAGSAALLPRPGVRDWIYAPDVADAVAALIEAARPRHRLYHISTGLPWPVLQWGQHLAALHPGFVCRLAASDEMPTVDLHGDVDRAPLSVKRLEQELVWRARFGCADSAADFDRWSARHGEKI